MKLPSIKRFFASEEEEDRIPRGAIIVVVIGVVATIAAALLSGGGGSGDAAHLEFVLKGTIPNSKAVAVPGSKTAKMQLVDGTIKATGTNVAGYELFRVRSTAKSGAGFTGSRRDRRIDRFHWQSARCCMAARSAARPQHAGSQYLGSVPVAGMWRE